MIFSTFVYNFTFFTITFWVLVYYYCTRNFSYWKTRNVKFITPIPFFGNGLPIFTLQKSIGELCRDLYRKTTEPFFGFFVCDEPFLLVNDPELIRTILIKDFDVFSNRTLADNKKDDPLGSHILFILKTPDWKEIRKKISPAFTSGKLKLMYNLIGEGGQDLVKYLGQQNNTVDIRDVSARYSTDVISSTSFGIHANCFIDENAEFRKPNKIYNWAFLERAVSTTCYFIAPNLVRLFKLRFIDKESGDFLRNAFWRIMREREKSGQVRNDLLDILREIIKEERIDDPYKLEGDKLVAQAAQFYIAGYETTSTTITFCLYEMALNIQVQQKLREEIVLIKEKHGMFGYEGLQEMEYLDWCIKEALRKYPALPFLDRRCNSDYQIPGTEVVLKKGTGVFISTLGLHYDSQYFPDPEKFDPDRFSNENFTKKHSSVYLPFGDGPRNCIGARFATLSAKSAIAHVLYNFKVEVAPETEVPVRLDNKGFLIAPKGNRLFLSFTRIRDLG